MLDFNYFRENVAAKVIKILLISKSIEMTQAIISNTNIRFKMTYCQGRRDWGGGGAEGSADSPDF